MVRKAPTEAPAEDLIEVQFDYNHSLAGAIPLKNAQVILDPTNGWAVRQYKVVLPKSVRAATVEYSDVPHPKLHFKHPTMVRLTVGDDAPPKSGDMAEHVYALKQIAFEDVDQREFTLAAFGLPEVVEAAQSKGGLSIWAIVALLAFIGAICLAVSRKLSKATR
jgi:hypothetical protein